MVREVCSSEIVVRDDIVSLSLLLPARWNGGTAPPGAQQWRDRSMVISESMTAALRVATCVDWKWGLARTRLAAGWLLVAGCAPSPPLALHSLLPACACVSCRAAEGASESHVSSYHIWGRVRGATGEGGRRSLGRAALLGGQRAVRGAGQRRRPAACSLEHLARLEHLE